MAYKVIWSKEAENSFLEIVDYIIFRWSEREGINFIERTEDLIAQITIHPYLFRVYNNDPSIRQGLLHKNTTMFYKVVPENKTIKIMLFWIVKKNPQSLKL